jgi:peptide-methionine (R)-S-oxide reductase
MSSRRQFLIVMATTGVLAPVVAWLGRAGLDPRPRRTFPIERSEAEWRRRLSPEAFHVLRERGTERPYSSPLNAEHRPGRFRCAGCRTAVFDAGAKFESGTGWPSFVRPVDITAVDTAVDRRDFQVRTEVLCARCGGHLGHVFSDGPPPTGLRYCMNGVALVFEPEPA